MKDLKRNSSTDVYLLFFFIWGFSFNSLHSACSQSNDSNSFPILFYNVENLFDCFNDSLTNDEEFLPNGNNHWSFYRYNNKVNKIAKVILASNNWNPPALVGLCEVENKKVMSRLVWETGLSEHGYRFVHHESPDRRGIDVALLYCKDKFEIIQERAVSMTLSERNFFTRDILYVKGVAFGSDTLNVFVCHWPSKYGGDMHSEWKRVYVASRLRDICDSLFAGNKDCNIIVMGDLNESPQSEAVYNSLKAREEGTGVELINLASKFKSDVAGGTIKYRGHWDIFDQIIVSNSLLQEPFTTDGMSIVDLPFLLEPDNSYSGVRPFRTYLGPQYHGGFSDHLPAKVVIRKR